MDAYDERVAREAREKQAAMGGDGWTVVVRAKVGYHFINPLRSEHVGEGARGAGGNRPRRPGSGGVGGGQGSGRQGG